MHTCPELNDDLSVVRTGCAVSAPVCLNSSTGKRFVLVKYTSFLTL